MSRILITRPEHDPLTRHLSHWNKKVIEIAVQKGNDVVDLHKEKANKREFEGRVKKTSPSLILLNGHGNDVSVTGHDNEVLVKVGENEHILKNKITYAVACASARILGTSCADENTTFIGYDEDFILNLDRRHLKDPLQDKRAERFLEPSNKVAISLIKGHSCQESSANSKRAFREKIKSLLASMEPGALDDAKDLFWNMNHQVCLGNQNARL